MSTQSLRRTPSFSAVGAQGTVGRLRAQLQALVLGVWLLVTGFGFWFRLARPAIRPRLAYKDQRAVHTMQQWYAQSIGAPVRGGSAAATVVLVPGAGCRCETPPVESFCRLAQRWRPHGLRFVIGDRATPTSSISDEAAGRILTIASAPRLPRGVNLMVFDRGGELQYAGPLTRINTHDVQQPAGLSLLDLLLERLVEDAPRVAVPMLYRPDCGCAAAAA